MKPDQDRVRRRKVDAAFAWLIRDYAPAFLRIAGRPEAARELEAAHLHDFDLEEFGERVFPYRTMTVGLPMDDPVWRKIEALRGPVLLAAKAWAIADIAAAFARDSATSEAERAPIDASICAIMKQLERNLDELLTAQEV
jgi:hypothetical protein